MRTYFLLFFMGLSSSLSALAQAGDFQSMEDSLKIYGQDMFALPSEPDRLQSNFSFIKLLVQTLKMENSFDYPFDDLDMVSILTPPDGSFRIFSWNIPLNDGSYLYYGSIQFRTDDGSLKLVPLLDKTFEISDPDKKILSDDNWYGAQYYEILPLQDSYILLGWKGHTADYTQKVIEILTVGHGHAKFGKNVFSDSPDLARKIFNYTRQASMYLKFHASGKHIIFDHIVPMDSESEGNYKYYGPDLSYDSYVLRGGRLVLEENVEFLNDY